MAAAWIRTIALFITLMVMSAACSRPQGPTAPTAELPTPPSEASTSEVAATTTPQTTEVADSYAIPADPKDIDKQYVEKVLEALSAGYVEATREVVASKSVNGRVKAVLAQTHTAAARASVMREFRSVLKANPDGGPFAPDPKPARIVVRELIDVSRTCIYTLVDQDLSGLIRGGGIEPFPSYYYLVPKDGERRQEFNPTPWTIGGNVEPLRSGKKFANPCK